MIRETIKAEAAPASCGQHTKGPWTVSIPGGQTALNGRRVTVTARGSMIADLDWNSPAENMANARLIAAAPDLLAALEAIFAECVLVHRFGGESYNQPAATAAEEAARAAIALAKGEGK